MALSTSTNWVSNFIIAFITPPLVSAAGGGYYFLLLGFCLISLVFVFFVYRETAGKTLEQLGDVFGEADVAIELQPVGEGRSLESITGKTIVAEPLGLLGPKGSDSALSSSSESSGPVSASDPLLSREAHNKMGLVEISLDDELERTSIGDLQTGQ